MLQSIIVYVPLAIFMILCGVLASQRERKILNYGDEVDRKISFFYLETLLPLFVFAVIFGCRYNVGVDYPAYLEGYLYGNDRELELLFGFVTEKCQGLAYIILFISCYGHLLKSSCFFIHSVNTAFSSLILPFSSFLDLIIFQ